MHPAAYSFVESVVPTAPGAVLDVGSLDVNGSVRALFGAATRYVGIDIRPGRGVDATIDCANYDGEQTFDTVVSTETMEHMRHPEELIGCAWRSLRPGGLLIITAAGPLRPHHGVDGGAVGQEFYDNITPEQLTALLRGWDDVQIVSNQVAHDLYATALKPEDSHGKRKSRS